MEHIPNNHVDHPIQHRDKQSNDYFRSYKVHQMLTAFILLCMIVIIPLLEFCLILAEKSWWREISDKYLFLILNFWHELLTIKMTPKRKSICHKIETRFNRFNKWHVILWQECKNSMQLSLYHPNIVLRYGQLAIYLNYSIKYNSQLARQLKIPAHTFNITEGPIVSWAKWADKI